jgi:hypothetical protein
MSFLMSHPSVHEVTRQLAIQITLNYDFNDADSTQYFASIIAVFGQQCIIDQQHLQRS